MHKLLDITEGYVCSKCGKPASHHYVIEDRGYSSLFDKPIPVEFWACDDCDEPHLADMVDEEPFIADNQYIYLMENLLYQYIESFGEENCTKVMWGEWNDTINAYREVESYDSYSEPIRTREEIDKSIEDAFLSYLGDLSEEETYEAFMGNIEEDMYE